MKREKIRRGVPEVIVALDVESGDRALELLDTLRGKINRFKVGSRLFTSEGPDIVGRINDRGASVFLDLKLHDIPATVAGSVRAATALGVMMMTLHTMGGLDMMRAAADTAAEQSHRLGVRRPLLVGVTVLTSMSAEDLAAVSCVKAGVEDVVLRLSARAREAGLDGVVASVREAERIKHELGGDFIVVTPGIRPAGTELGDQKRIATPRIAAKAGSDYLVIGRPIIGDASPADAAEAVLRELREACGKGC